MNSALILVSLLLQYSDKIAAVSKLLNTVHTEGRDVTAAELDALFADDDAAKAALDAAIAAAKLAPATV